MAIDPILTEFLKMNCRAPEKMEGVFEGAAKRASFIRDGEYLCRKGDDADEMWILLKGRIRVEDGGLIVVRKVGELVGEAAFFRPQSGRRVRGANMIASGDVSAFRIDASVVGTMDVDQRLLWQETISAVLTAKLDQAQRQRSELRASTSVLEKVIHRFVCNEGFDATWGAISAGGASTIDPEVCDTLVWFSDLAGFSSYATGLKPADVGTLVREMMELQSSAIMDAGGQIDKYMGDGLMSFWRVPDDVRRNRLAPKAVEAALEARNRIQHFALKRDLPLDIRIGMHIGKAVIGDFGSAERIAFTLIGETVNSASRFEQARACSEGKALGRVRLSKALYDILPAASRSGFEPETRSILDKHKVAHDLHSSLDGA
ncbi:adenylate/guanylate cyclase domain-containing protein [Rhizobium johnstonii]